MERRHRGDDGLHQPRGGPDTSEADLADAHAIIRSMRTEPSDNHLGFRPVFTLTNNDWDSG